MKKKLAAIAMATAMAASLAACSSKPAETTAAAEENEETTAEAAEGSEAAEAGDSAFAGKTLVMSTNAEFAPYEYHDGNDIVGIDVDIANAICEDMGASLEITDVAFDSIIGGSVMAKLISQQQLTVPRIVRPRWISLTLTQPAFSLLS